MVMLLGTCRELRALVLVAVLSAAGARRTKGTEKLVRPHEEMSEGSRNALAVLLSTIDASSGFAFGPYSQALNSGRTNSFTELGSLRSERANVAMAEPMTVSAVREKFYAAYGQNFVPFISQGFVNEMLSSMTFAMSSGDWTYSRVFALGFKKLCLILQDSVPDEEKRLNIEKSMLTAVGLKPDTIMKDAEQLEEKVKDMSESDLLASDDMTKITNAKNFKYSYQIGAGLFTLMDAVGVEKTEDNIERWASELNLRPVTIQKDLVVYKDVQTKMAEAKQMLLEASIREKRKKAKALEEKAQRLAAEAAKIEAAEKAAAAPAEAAPAPAEGEAPPSA
jgi:hypothetical protein